MRAPFDRFADLYFGPDTITPGALRYSELACRVVSDIAFRDDDDPLDTSLAYLTCEDIAPNGPRTLWAGGQDWTFNFGFGDQVALNHGAAITHQVVRVELRMWHTGTSYWRAHLSPLFSTVPSGCSAAYTAQYRWGLGGPGLNIVNQIGPTTWVDGPWTLQAEASGPPGVGCGSLWIMSNGLHTWRSFYNGTAGVQILISTDGGTPVSLWIQPVP